ncbi:hypothetical protein Syun_018301 [Stephania yunnanensis]|uniref:Uncharacterized protein n=1 Tax=Stephania yunnanensis TaxID=152371 RepID=A0AAP0NW69_9MAGN
MPEDQHHLLDDHDEFRNLCRLRNHHHDNTTDLTACTGSLTFCAFTTKLLEQMRRHRRKEYSISPQVYVETDQSRPLHRKGRALLGLSKTLKQEQRHPIRIYLNYDVVGHSPDRDCQSVGDIVKVSVVSNHCDLATFGY